MAITSLTMFDMATRVWLDPTYDNSETVRVLGLDEKGEGEGSCD